MKKNTFKLNVCRLFGQILLGTSIVILTYSLSFAVPIISIDIDPLTPGIQSSILVAQGDTINVDVLLTGDGFSLFDSIIVDFSYNDMGSILGLTGPPTAGSIAGTAPFLAIDLFSGMPASISTPLTTLPSLPLPGFADNTGAFGLTSLSLPFTPFLPAGQTIDLFSLSFDVLTLGSSNLMVSGSPFGSPVLAFGGVPIPTDIQGASVAPVPEPSTLFLLGTGLIGVASFGARKRKTRK